ncbi:hypothetical protein CJI59_16740 [Streptomyces sp. Alain-F2R5]|nr:hypothetical protein [Streptomyces sp. Alain-F2R5]PAN00532.1 hypothetical protein CJI59_16740 [Streptomyces sp. Alain-F2R5]
MRLRKSPASAEGAGPSPSPVRRTDQILLTLALVAGIAVTAAGEWELARQVGISPVVAPLLAVVIDVYVIAAVRAGQGRDVAAALAMMGGAQVAAHLLSTRHIGSSVALVAAVSLVAPVVIWRVHALAGIGKAVVVQSPAEPTVNVSRASTPPWKPATPKWSPALQAHAVKAVSPALAPRSEVVTARVSPEQKKVPESPQKPTADVIVRTLYDSLGGKRPGTAHIRDALKAAGLPCSDGTCREARKRVEAREPALKTLPPA